MDTKKLFIKTQINVINWALSVAFILFALSLVAPTKTGVSFTTIAPAIMNGITFFLLLKARLKLTSRSALYAVFSFVALFAYYLITFLVSLPKTIELIKTTTQTGISPLPIVASVVIAYAFYGACAYLFYKAYKAVRYIEELSRDVSLETEGS